MDWIRLNKTAFKKSWKIDAQDFETLAPNTQDAGSCLAKIYKLDHRTLNLVFTSELRNSNYREEKTGVPGIRSRLFN